MEIAINVKTITETIIRKNKILLKYLFAWDLFLATSLIISVLYPISEKIEKKATYEIAKEYLPKLMFPSSLAIIIDNINDNAKVVKWAKNNEIVFLAILLIVLILRYHLRLTYFTEQFLNKNSFYKISSYI